MTTDYVSLETAKLLKGAGFNTKHEFVLYDVEKGILESHNISLWSAAKWLREVHKMYIQIENVFTMSLKTNVGFMSSVEIPDESNYTMNRLWGSMYFESTYEQVLDAAIQEACKLIINGKV